jgi:hypothetical protein
MAVVAAAGVLAFCVEMRRRWERPPHLRAGDGPFMVLVHVFRGPEAESLAERLAAELRSGHDLPAYLLRMSRLARPGGSRATGEDGVAVLVGDARTIDEAERLMRLVKRIQPESPADTSGAGLRLRRAMVTQNPIPAAR